MALHFDTGSDSQTVDELRLLAEAILQADSVDESDWLEWKSTLDLSDKRHQFQLSKHILGFANRPPDSASRNCKGYGYIFVGIEPSSSPGVTRLDPAELQDAINPYVGSDGPSWRHSYIQINGTDILAIVVDAPKSGDPFHMLRKEYDGSHSGTIFVRKQGKTERADPEDIRNLQERYRESRLDLTIESANSEPIPWFNLEHVNYSIQHIARIKRSSMLKKARNSTGGFGSDLLSISQALAFHNRLERPDQRTIEQYEQEVDEWQGKWVEQAREKWLLKYLNCDYGLASLTLTNTTDRNFSSVEVRLEIAGATVLTNFEKSDPDLPAPPREFGQPIPISINYPSHLSPRSFIPQFMQDSLAPSLVAQNHDGGSRVVWDAGDICPRGVARSDSFHFSISSSHRDNLSCRWTATTTSADGINEGQLHISTRESPVAFDDIDHGIEVASP